VRGFNGECRPGNGLRTPGCAEPVTGAMPYAAKNGRVSSLREDPVDSFGLEIMKCPSCSSNL
jgi:hypothetical protein